MNLPHYLKWTVWVVLPVFVACVSGLTMENNTPAPSSIVTTVMPTADVMVNVPPTEPVVVSVGQTIVVPGPFQDGMFWEVSFQEPGPNYGDPVLEIMHSPDPTASSRSDYWLFRAIAPGKVDVEFLGLPVCPTVTLTLSPDAVDECSPAMKLTMAVEVLSTTSTVVPP